MFLIFAVVIAVISMTVIDNSAPLEIEALRLSFFGKAWNIFILPGVLATLPISIIVFTAPLCLLGVSCAGLIDGGPIDHYLFFVMSILIGVLYGLALTYLVEKLTQWRKRNHRS